MADPEKLRQKVSKVVSTRGVRIEQHYLAPGYEVKLPEKAILGDTGHLRSLEITSSDPTSPSFLGRWDDADTAFDIDLVSPDPTERDSFKHCRDGSSGHHTARSTATDRREYHVNIVYHHKPIFEGIVQLSLDAEEGLTIAVQMGVSFTAE